MYHFTLQTSKICLCRSQDLHGEMYFDLRNLNCLKSLFNVLECLHWTSGHPGLVCPLDFSCILSLTLCIPIPSSVLACPKSPFFGCTNFPIFANILHRIVPRTVNYSGVAWSFAWLPSVLSLWALQYSGKYIHGLQLKELV